MRPFLKLKPEQFPGAWKQALKKAKDGKVTGKVAEQTAEEMFPQRAKPKRKAYGFKWPKNVPGGQILGLLQKARGGAEKNEPDQVFSALEEIENLLFGVVGSK